MEESSVNKSIRVVSKTEQICEHRAYQHWLSLHKNLQQSTENYQTSRSIRPANIDAK